MERSLRDSGWILRETKRVFDCGINILEVSRLHGANSVVTGEITEMTSLSTRGGETSNESMAKG